MTGGHVRVCAVLTTPVLVLSAVPAWQFDHWPWICLSLAAPVVVWGGFPGLRRAVRTLRAGSCDDGVPIALGTAGALAWSLVALLAGPPGDPGWTQRFGPLTTAGPPVRLDVAAGITLAVLVAAAVGARPPRTPGSLRRVVVPSVLAVAAGALGYRLGAGYDAGVAVPAAIATLLVAAPAAFDVRGPARPPDPRVTARRVDAVVLTARALESGERRVESVHTTEDTDPDQVLRLAGSVAGPSEHPSARAVAVAAAQRGAVPDVAEFDEHPGLGVSGLVAELRPGGTDAAGSVGAAATASVGAGAAGPDERPRPEPTPADGRPSDPGGAGDPVGGDVLVADATVVAHAVLVGHPALLDDHGIALPDDLDGARRAAEEAGHPVVAVAWDGRARAVLVVALDPAPDVAAAVRSLRRRGPVPVLPSGPAGAAVREAAGCSDEDAVEVGARGEIDGVAALRADGRVVAVVGATGRDDDALAAADLALAVGAPHPDARAAVAALRRLRRTPGPVPWATTAALAYHLVALPVAAVGALDPLLAGAAGACVTAAVGWHRRAATSDTAAQRRRSATADTRLHLGISTPGDARSRHG